MAAIAFQGKFREDSMCRFDDNASFNATDHTGYHEFDYLVEYDNSSINAILNGSHFEKRTSFTSLSEIPAGLLSRYVEDALIEPSCLPRHIANVAFPSTPISHGGHFEKWLPWLSEKKNQRAQYLVSMKKK